MEEAHSRHEKVRPTPTTTGRPPRPAKGTGPRGEGFPAERNVEIKAAARHWEAQMERAAALASAREELGQQDTFFACADGRLKLRTVTGHTGEQTAWLIFYRRRDAPGPTASDYALCAVSDPDALRRVLALALGEAGSVGKRRTVFHCGQTRVHFDDVAGLGRFIELEVVLRQGQSVEEGAAVARELMQRLLIQECDLVSGAYADLLGGG